MKPARSALIAASRLAPEARRGLLRRTHTLESEIFRNVERFEDYAARVEQAGELRRLPLAERLERVRAAINALGPPAGAEAPAAPAPDFAARVAEFVARGVPEPQAVLRSVLAERAEAAAAELSPEGRALCAELAQQDAGARPSTRPWWAALADWLRGGPADAPANPADAPANPADAPANPADDRVAAHWGNECR